MALFKFAGTKADLDRVNKHDGYVYVCADEKQDENGHYTNMDEKGNRLGEWFVDIGTTRYRLAAAALIDPDGEVVNIDDLVRQGEILEVTQGGTGKKSVTANALLIGDGEDAMKEVASTAGVLQVDQTGNAPAYGTVPIGFGGTGGTTPAAARSNLKVSSTNEMNEAISTQVASASAASFTTSIPVSEWVAHTVDGETDYYFATQVIDGVTCGVNHDVPPLVSLADEENIADETWDAYYLIYRVIVDYDPVDKRSTFRFYAKEPPEVALNLIIVDVR